MANGKWKPVSFRRVGISHLFFADELIPFGKALVQQASLVNDILSKFCTYSGHAISKGKSMVYCSQNIGVELSDYICKTLEMRGTKDLGKFLGIPLLYRRVSVCFRT